MKTWKQIIIIGILVILAITIGCTPKKDEVGKTLETKIIKPMGGITESVFDESNEQVHYRENEASTIQIPQAINAYFIFGQWEDEATREYVHIFSENYNYRWALKETSNAENGRWQLNVNTLTIIHTDDGWEDYINPRIDEVQITIINDNNILLIYPDGKRLSLIRVISLEEQGAG